MASGFGDVNPGVLAGGGINEMLVEGNEMASGALYAMVGGVIGAFLGWAIKDNVLD